MKPAWQSKRVWWTVLGAAAAIIQAFTGAVIPPEWQLVAWNVVMIVIALVSKEPIAWQPTPPTGEPAATGTDPEPPLGARGTGERGSAVPSTAIGTAVVGLVLLALLALTSTGCGRLSDRDARIAEASVTTLNVSCQAVTDTWCQPGAEIIPASVCRWLVPGCLGARGLASVVLDAAVPKRTTKTGLYLMREEAPNAPIIDMQEWIASCVTPHTPLCDDVRLAHAERRDLVLLATE